MNRRLLCWRGAKREPDRAKHQETGWLVQPPLIFLIGTTPSAPFKGGFAAFLLMAQPPLLIRGGEFCSTQNLVKETRKRRICVYFLFLTLLRLLSLRHPLLHLAREMRH